MDNSRDLRLGYFFFIDEIIILPFGTMDRQRWLSYDINQNRER
ncbi:hypothetical protein J2Z37_005120 [Ammoniphilus resinae]|uniref:Uncharacterized protein n=1 Tax=Ammoniphilus resinae TaxID=861532 RepID=A0ABS4GXU2_9BACL|nr:hypothetical protein [Ammoniphilus resinae]